MYFETLKKRREFLHAAKSNIVYKGKSVIIQCITNNNLSSSINIANKMGKYPVSVGFTASKRVGNSPSRNFSKRRLRECIRLIIQKNDRFSRQLPFSFVFIAKKLMLKLEFLVVLEDIERGLQFCIKNANIK